MPPHTRRMPGAGSAPTGPFLRSHRVSAARYRDGYSKCSGQRQFEKARVRSPAIQRLRRLADNGSVATFVPRTSPGALAAPDAASSLAYPTRDRQGPTGTLYCRDHASGARRVSRRLGRADQSFRQAPRQLSLRQDRSTAQPPHALVRHGRATPRLRSKSTAFLVLPRSPFPAVVRSISSPEYLETRCPRHLLTILHERLRQMNRKKSRPSSRKTEPASGQVGMSPHRIGLGDRVLLRRAMGPSRYRHCHHRRAFLAGGVIGLAEADFAGLVFSALLFFALAVAIRSNFLMALLPLNAGRRSAAVPATRTPSTC